MKVLFIEDDRKISEFVKKGLRELGVVVDTCEDGEEGFVLALSQPYDVLLLDIMLPGRDGLAVLRELRERKNSIPVILLTARSALNERVEGLNLGADDYLSKPFYIEELLARIHAVSRRSNGLPVNAMEDGDLVVDLIAREAKTEQGKVELTAREFNLLGLLMRSAGRVYTRTQILEHVWGYCFDPQTNVVDVYIRRLRGKIDVKGKTSRIETVRGVGYRFNRLNEG
ncbi:MAG: response regulator transcription factor [Deltaproteobacteria bacterium]|nr:response regulator transcription factor [Deltaproteobacteria bacterium]